MKWAPFILACSACSSELQLFAFAPDAGAPSLDAAATEGGMPANDAATPLGPITLGSAFQHTCALRDGALYCWGDNAEGQLGLGDTMPRLAPVQVALPGPAAAACAGEAHSCALLNDGRLSCWGKNLHGELGLGDFLVRTSPESVPGALRFTRIACGGYDSCAITEGGALYCWGENFEGKLGQDDPFTGDDLATPTRVAAGRVFRDVGVGQGHVCAVTREGELYCWGRNSDGQLGLGTDVTQVRRPTRVGTGSDYRSVAAGQRHTCALHGSGTLSCWGTDSEGSLGLGIANEARVDTPREVTGEQGYDAVAVDWFHSCATRRGALLCWGRNAEGQLGLGDSVARNVPTPVAGVSGVRSLALGQFHTCAVGGQGLACWGENDARGQLGLGRPGRESTPTAVSLP